MTTDPQPFQSPVPSPLLSELRIDDPRLLEQLEALAEIGGPPAGESWGCGRRPPTGRGSPARR